MSDRKLTLVKSSDLGDWYCIEWADHAQKMWMEPCEYGFALVWSGRVSDADIEGTAAEMSAIAEAIEKGESVSFYRCSAAVEEGGYVLNSPRNSTRDGLITLEQARHLASEIRRVLSEQPPVV